MAAANSNDDAKLELSKLVEDWNENRRKDDYNPIPFLIKLSELLERETEEFHKQDPDPFDDRHPIYTSPNSALGKLLKYLTKQDDFLDVLINTYLKSRDRTHSDKYSDSYQPSLCEVAARVLLVIIPGLDALSVFTDNSGITSQLYQWIFNENETLRTYATGILSAAVEHQDINSHHTKNNAKLVPLLLKRLWNYIEPGKYFTDTPTTSNTSAYSQNTSNSLTSHDTPTTSGIKAKAYETKITPSRKRKLSEENVSKKVKARRTCEKIYNIPKFLNKPNNSKNSEDTAVNCKSPSWENGVKSDNFPLVDINECSNSSWVDIAPVVIGCSYKLTPPLSPVICQRCIIKVLIPLGEYQDLLSHFIEHKALDLIRYYLDKSNSNDGILTFLSLRLLASLLCHYKIATKFIDSNGVQRILSVRRPSIGATGVSLCIYYLAYNQDAMDRVCQLPNKVLVELVKYATWLLECSHDSGQCHAALFFNISFQFHVILKLFDQRNGLRFLLNMLSMLPIIRLDNENQNQSKDDEDSHRQTAKTACQALKKYFETHLSLKATLAREMLKITQVTTAPSTNSSMVIISNREEVFRNLHFLNTSIPKLPPNFFSSWSPIQTFIKLDGVKLLLRLIALACRWSNYYAKADIVRFALDCLAVVTLSLKAQCELCNPVNLPPSMSEETGISIILCVAEGEVFSGFEPEAQKSALSVIINCVCGPHYKFDGAMGKIINGTPQMKIFTSSLDPDRQKLWECVKTHNGIKILLHLLLNKLPVFYADDIRLLACKALCGLSVCESVKQIMSKLPIFNTGQIQALTKQPVMQDGKKQHLQFCKYVEELTERVSGKPSILNMDLDSVRKAHIVSQTIIRFDNHELLQLIHNHLVWSGFHSSAATLAKEASLYSPSTSSASMFTTPKSTSRLLAGGDASSCTPMSRKISFSRGDHATGETPTLAHHNSHHIAFTPTLKRGKNKFRFEVISNSSTNSTGLSDMYKLSSNGKVTVMKRDDIVNTVQLPSSSTTLNSIVAGYLQNQHSQCKNPVVTVPEFSLMRPHYCPSPRYKVEAPLNVASRIMRRQISPRYGGLGGACCDRQLIYNRFRPHAVFRAPDEERVPYTCCAFTPDDINLILGNYQGDLTIRGVHSEMDRVIEGVCQAPVVAIEPAKDGKRMLVVEENLWRNGCALFSLESMAVKLTYDDSFYVEFSKTFQDKVVGTKTSSTLIYDAETGQKIQKLERADLASHYTNNKATFSPNDELVLSDGVLWDIRSSNSRPIHKFDKFNASVSGVFHPQGLEVIINTEVWDLRNYHLLHTVPSIDQCSIYFNSDGSIIYAAKVLNNMDLDEFEEDDLNSVWTTFMAIDSQHYRPISVTDTKHKIYNFAVDSKDCFVATIERQYGHSDPFQEGPSMSVCRMYEVGRRRGEDDDDEQDEEGLPEDDDDNNEDDDMEDDNLNDDDDFSGSSFNGSDSSYEVPSFAMLSSSSSSTGNSRRSRRQRRRSTSSDDDGWSTVSDENSSASEGGAGSTAAGDDVT